MSIRAGISRVDITPPVGVDLAGYAARETGSTGIHDRLFARAIVLDDGRTRAALITCDLMGLDTVDVGEVRLAAEKAAGVPAENIMVAASHTHSAPATMQTNGIGMVDAGWLKVLKGKMVQSVVKAEGALSSVLVGAGKGVTTIGVNRGGVIPEGSIDLLPDPLGTVDRELLTVSFTAVGERMPRAVLFNCGCHPTVLGADNRLISADYPGEAARFIEGTIGAGSLALFTAGGAANVDPAERGSFEHVQRAGERLGAEAVRVALSGSVETATDLAVRRKCVSLPFAHIPCVEECGALITKYSAMLQRAGKGSVEGKIAEACLDWARNLKKRLQTGSVPSALTAEIQGLSIGRISLVAVPAEVFAETAMAIKQQFQSLHTLVVGYANGNLGYLAPGSEILKGGYEVREGYKYYDLPSPYRSEAEENVIAAASRLLTEHNNS